jgi:hypothetical protein
VETWRTIYGDREEADLRARALDLFGWLLRQPNRCATETALVWRQGPTWGARREGES